MELFTPSRLSAATSGTAKAPDLTPGSCCVACSFSRCSCDGTSCGLGSHLKSNSNGPCLTFSGLFCRHASSGSTCRSRSDGEQMRPVLKMWCSSCSDRSAARRGSASDGVQREWRYWRQLPPSRSKITRPPLPTRTKPRSRPLPPETPSDSLPAAAPIAAPPLSAGGDPASAHCTFGTAAGAEKATADSAAAPGAAANGAASAGRLCPGRSFSSSARSRVLILKSSCAKASSSESGSSNRTSSTRPTTAGAWPWSFRPPECDRFL
mmetsp:Transcript_14625/g.47791  ORF Transcript_14625/g.47791 Transcript_14625/m.47791 type:complete len:265 (-) Transcript_14625:1099-1893(-)